MSLYYKVVDKDGFELFTGTYEQCCEFIDHHRYQIGLEIVEAE